MYESIAQLVEHCNTDAEAMGLNNYSIKAPPPLFFVQVNLWLLNVVSNTTVTIIISSFKYCYYL